MSQNSSKINLILNFLGYQIMKIRYLILFLCSLICLNSLPVFADTEEVYRFERMWPVLQQPWYFDGLWDIEVSSQGYVYVVNREHNRIDKLTLDGHLISHFGTFHDDFGPTQMAVDSEENFYVIYRHDHLTSMPHFIRKFNALGDLISDKWGEESQCVKDGGVHDIAVDNQDHVYITCGSTKKQPIVEKLSKDGTSLDKFFVKSLQNNNESRMPAPKITIDDNYVYVVESVNHRIQKYTTNGKFVKSWGSYGSEEGKFKYPKKIDTDSQGNVYVTDNENNRIQKFTSEGEFIKAWPEKTDMSNWDKIICSSPLLLALKILNESNILEQLFDMTNRLEFDLNELLKEILSRDISEIESFFLNSSFQPTAIAIDPQDNVYVTYNILSHIKKYTSNGKLLNRWSSFGNGDKQFNTPIKITRDKSGNLYVTDWLNHRVSKFTADGQLMTQWGEPGSGEGQFILPSGIATDTEGNVYVVDTGNVRIQKFDANGQFILQWGGTNFLSRDNCTLDIMVGLEIINFLTNYKDNFVVPSSIAIDKNNNVYVVDSFQKRIYKFTSEGELIKIFGDDAGLSFPLGITVDNDDNIYVVDFNNHNIKQFTTEGDFIKEWGKQGHENGLFDFPSDVVTDDNGNIYISDSNNHRIQKFTSEGTFITQWGEFGTNPGQLSKPLGLTVTPDGNQIYVVETVNNRIQVFNRNLYDVGKAIIIAGMRSKTDQLWNDTQMVANFAYRTLTYQGFTKDSIYYIIANTKLDLDNNGELDDVDAIPTEENLKYAITEWAKEGGNNNLTIYMTDHGGSEKFQLNEGIELSVTKLNDWLNTLQMDMTGSIKVIYDACQSGSFVPKFVPPEGKNRIVITSSAANQNAYFNSQGSLSFSSFFWNHIFNGVDIASAFSQTQEAIDYLQGQTSQKQTPQLDANSDGIANDVVDFEQVTGVNIGNGTKYQMDAPVIDTISVSPSQILIGTNTASITVKINDEDIAKVWIIVRTPADLKRIVTGETIETLPSFELKQIENNRYEATYNDFTQTGTYQLAIYARDKEGNTSIPKTTTISVESYFKNKAIIIAGDLPLPIQNTQQAYNALDYQGYENIYYLNSISQLGVDVLTTLDNVEFALTEWPQDNTQNIVIYLEGWGDETAFMVNGTEILPFAKLDEWLDNLQNNINGAITVIYEGPYSGYLLPALTTPTGKERIVITSTGQNEIECLNQESLELFFSQIFWQAVRKGTRNTNEAFVGTKKLIRNIINERYPDWSSAHRKKLLPQLDDNGNGVGNEEGKDGKIAEKHNIGTGIITADIEPLMGKVSPQQFLNGEKTAMLWVKNVTTIGTSATVWATINPPCHTDEKAAKIKLEPVGDNKYQTKYGKFLSEGIYKVTFYAEDESHSETRLGRRSLPKRTLVHQQQSVKRYRHGEFVQEKLPAPVTDNHDYYVALQLPDGSLLAVKMRNQFEPFALNAMPVWEGGNGPIINKEITPSIPRGEYKLYWVRLPKGNPLLPLEQHTLNQSTFYVEE